MAKRKPKPIVCEYCGFKAKGIRGLKIHTKAKHRGAPAYTTTGVKHITQADLVDAGLKPRQETPSLEAEAVRRHVRATIDGMVQELASIATATRQLHLPLVITCALQDVIERMRGTFLPKSS